MKKLLNAVAMTCILTAAALSGCASTDNGAETQEAAENTADDLNDPGNEDLPLNFNVKVTGAETEGNVLSVMYQVSLPEVERPSSDMEFESIKILNSDGADADCEFGGSELYSGNGQDDVYRAEFTFDGGVPAGNYWLELKNYGYYDGDSFINSVDGSWMFNCVVGSDKTSADVDVAGTKIGGIELTGCELNQTSIVIRYICDSGSEKLGDVTLNFKDGGKDDVSDTTDKTTSSESDGSAVTIINFNDMVDINDVESVDIMGQTFGI